MGIYRDNISAIIYYRLSLSLKPVLIYRLPISFRHILCFVIADKLSRLAIFYACIVKNSKLVSWRYGKNTRCPLNLAAVLKKSLFVLFNDAAESVNCSLVLKNLEKYFCSLTYKKKLRPTH